MIKLEHLADGSVSDRNFLKLMSLVVDTGGQSVGVRFGTDTITFAASTNFGPKTISHGLGRAPIVVFVIGSDTAGSFGGICSYTTASRTTTSFDVYARAPVAGSQTNAIAWLAIG